jgi:hypothetical protein
MTRNNNLARSITHALLKKNHTPDFSDDTSANEHPCVILACVSPSLPLLLHQLKYIGLVVGDDDYLEDRVVSSPNIKYMIRGHTCREIAIPAS